MKHSDRPMQEVLTICKSVSISTRYQRWGSQETQNHDLKGKSSEGKLKQYIFTVFIFVQDILNPIVLFQTLTTPPLSTITLKGQNTTDLVRVRVSQFSHRYLCSVMCRAKPPQSKGYVQGKHTTDISNSFYKKYKYSQAHSKCIIICRAQENIYLIKIYSNLLFPDPRSNIKHPKPESVNFKISANILKLF